MEKYEILTLIGEGSFGRVYKAKKKNSYDVVALKLISKYCRSQNDINCLRQECEIQKDLKHPNIIRMIDSFETDCEIVVVTEFAKKDLYQLLGEHCYFNEDRASKIICDLISALYYLHSNRVLHRDLKPQNVLISADGVTKLCDFGFARHMSRSTHVLTSIKGTPLYMAPELMEESPYDHNADIWSLGCISFEMLVGTPPFITKSILHLVKLIKHEAIKWPDFLSENCLSFLKGVLNKDPSKRLSWPHLLEHPFVQGKVLILSDQGEPVPLTAELTVSQVIAKEKQKISCAAAKPISVHPDIDWKMGRIEAMRNAGKLTSPVKCEGRDENCSPQPAKLVSREKNEEELEAEWKEEVGWDDSSALEAEEWLAFLQNSIEEIMEGDVESVSEPAFVTMVTRALSSPSPSVIDYIASLFSIPFVVDTVPEQRIEKIKSVYVEAGLIGKLVYCSKIIIDNSREGELCAESLQALESVFLLITYLAYGSKVAVNQLSRILKTLRFSSHFTLLLNLRKRKLRLAQDVLAILALLLKTHPEDSIPLMKTVILSFDKPENELRSMLTHSSDCLRRRLLIIIKLMAENCPELIQLIWSEGIFNDIEALSYDSSQNVREIAENVLEDLKKVQTCL